MAAALGDAAVAQHQDLVGVHHGGQPVADDEHRSLSLTVAAQAGQDRRRGARVDRRQRVVEQQQPAQAVAGQQRAGDRHALALAARERDAALTHRCVVALRQTQDVVVHRCLACGGLDLGAAGIGPGQRDVFGHAGREQECLLRHPGDG